LLLSIAALAFKLHDVATQMQRTDSLGALADTVQTLIAVVALVGAIQMTRGNRTGRCWVVASTVVSELVFLAVSLVISSNRTLGLLGGSLATSIVVYVLVVSATELRGQAVDPND
jgi:hypothetical protein